VKDLNSILIEKKEIRAKIQKDILDHPNDLRMDELKPFDKEIDKLEKKINASTNDNNRKAKRIS
jgi:hypothetical protein